MLNILKRLAPYFAPRNIFDWMGGRNWVLAVFFSFTSFWLARHGLLTKEYAGAIIAIQGFITYRSIHEDRKEVAMAAANADSDSSASNTTIVNVEPAAPATGSEGEKG